MKKFDLTPEGCKTKAGIKRINKAIEARQDIDSEFFRKLDEIIGFVPVEEFVGMLVRWGEMSAEEAKQEYEEIQQLREKRRACDDEFLRAIANRPPAS